MDNLILPNLKELFLHRNEITKIGNLAGCPKIRKLWLFQNSITKIENLHSLSELTELWLQYNNINKLTGLENNLELTNLGLAGNPINDFKEIKRLSSCNGLKSVTFTDIHFGRCPIADEQGYIEFILLHLPQVIIIDGVVVSKETQLLAEDMYYSQVRRWVLLMCVVYFI